MKISIVKEADPQESRVAITPDTTRRLINKGFAVHVESKAGLLSSFTDSEYEAAGASIHKKRTTLFSETNIILSVRRPDKSVKEFPEGIILICLLDPFDQEAALVKLAAKKTRAFAMELMPRVTRAQTMDVLSSQANLAGYQAVLEATNAFTKALPMMMTAGGTIPAAKVFIMGAGVAGLQAIATARRLGAIVTATDVRPASKEQVESLGAKFIAVEDEEFRSAETSSGYAKEMSDEYKIKQADLVSKHIAKQDIVITTALIPGRPAPILVSESMINSMPSGSVIVDMAVERGGNCESSELGKVINVNNVQVVGYPNLAGRIPSTASSLYARNLASFIEVIIRDENGALGIHLDDELAKATLVTDQGKIVNSQFSNQDKVPQQPDDFSSSKNRGAGQPKTVGAQNEEKVIDNSGVNIGNTKNEEKD